MDKDFWLQIWRDGAIGFHQREVTPLLRAHWGAVGVVAGSRVLVPLAGKSLDLLWLAEQGHRVLGVELSPLAVAQFFDEHGLTPRVHRSGLGTHHIAGAIEVICGDVFALDAATLADCDGVYDRAALIALSPAQRARYVAGVYARLPPGCRGLLVTLEYPQQEMAGPPFSVDQAEVRRLFMPDWQIEQFERHDILRQKLEFAERGLTALHSAAYRLVHGG